MYKIPPAAYTLVRNILFLLIIAEISAYGTWYLCLLGILITGIGILVGFVLIVITLSSVIISTLKKRPEMNISRTRLIYLFSGYVLVFAVLVALSLGLFPKPEPCFL